MNQIGLYWGKTAKTDSDSKTVTWHPLLLHLIDVASCAEAVLLREPLSTRQRIAQVFGLEWDQALPWLLFVIASHDVGKVCPSFQLNKNAPPHINSNLKAPLKQNFVKHGFVSQAALSEYLFHEQSWSEEFAYKVADAVGCHHGERAAPTVIENLGRYELGEKEWERSRIEIFKVLLKLFEPTLKPTKVRLNGPDFMLLAGLTSFADWIGSNVDWFPFGNLQDTDNLKSWFMLSRKKAQSALDWLGWETRHPLTNKEVEFEEVFKQKPRPLQVAISKVVKKITEPSVILVEAPMGEGKTEAAFYAHLELQRILGHRGLYIALPTKATGNAMFSRTVEFLSSQGLKRSIDLQLLHGATLLNEKFQNLQLKSVFSDESDKIHRGMEGEVRAGEWFTHKKRALLSEYGVGTIDQVLLGILPVKHQFVRLWGLANRVIVFDEIHAYDEYTGTLLIQMVRWLIHLNSSVILLSATLPPSIRKKLADILEAEMPDQDISYPRITLLQRKKNVTQISFNGDPSRRCLLEIEAISEELVILKLEMEKKIVNGGMGLILVNTVDRAQKLYGLFPKGNLLIKNDTIVGKKLSDGTEVFLFHARFPANQRQHREDHMVSIFGVNSMREGKKILIATQVVEQSLDLDFDCIVTDLAPIDLILQRAGRLWRHQRLNRPIEKPILLIAGLKGDTPPEFVEPLSWNKIYREDVLLQTWLLLKSKTSIVLPDDIDSLVQIVYEELFKIPEFLQERFDKTLERNQGEASAKKTQANRVIIGLPDDASWDKPENFIQFDDDSISSHPSLMAKTRLGESSVIAIPIFHNEHKLVEKKLTSELAKEWYLRALNLSRKSVVYKIQNNTPDSWRKSSLLRNCCPMKFDYENRWIEDSSVRLDAELGLVYE